MTTRQTRPAKAVPGTDVFARTVPLLIEKHYFGESKSASLAPMRIDGQTKEEQTRTKSLLSLSKRLIDSEELRRVRYRDKEFRETLKGLATPFRPGLWLVPVQMAETADAEAQRWEIERQALVDAAATAYPAHIRSMKEPLGPLFNPADYPKVDVFRAKFWVDWRFIDFGVAAILKEVRADIFRRETEKLQRQAGEARVLIEQHLRGGLLDITKHLRDLLTPKGSNKKVVLRPNSFDKLTEFLATVEARDVTGDEDLRRVVKQLRTVAKSLDLEILREDKDMREKVTEEMNEITTQLEALVVEAPTRAIRIRDEEVA